MLATDHWIIINELQHIDSAFDYSYLIHKNVISITLLLLKKMNNLVIYVLAGNQGGLDPTVLFTTNCLNDLAGHTNEKLWGHRQG